MYIILYINYTFYFINQCPGIPLESRFNRWCATQRFAAATITIAPITTTMPPICTGRSVWSSSSQPSVNAAIGSKFINAALLTAPMRGSNTNRLVIAVPYKIVSRVSPIQPAPSRGSAKPSVTRPIANGTRRLRSRR